MSADQTPVYRAAPITQRDGSSLENSNCRMASIATGLDYETTGAKTSTGKAMRSKQDDQSGGTDSGDARQAWDRGYNEALTVRDGSTWADALDDLGDGRLVHLDVWAATVGGPCLSGSGSYGHTIAVAPDCKDGAWLVADPWCKPGSWVRVAESKLKAGAETWGGQVYGRAAQEADWPTEGTIDPRDPIVLAIVARIVRALMTEARPGRPGSLADVDPPDTGGAQPILYTVTHAQEADMPGPFFSPKETIGQATVKVDGANMIATSDGVFHPVARGYLRNVAGVVTMTDPYKGETAYLVSIGDGQSGLLLADHVDYVPAQGGDSPDVDEAIAARDQEWVEWVLAGSPADDPQAP